MFAGKSDAADRAKQIVRVLTDYRGNKTHNRHIHLEECSDMGLDVEPLEKNGSETLQDLVLTVHHCYMHSLMNTGAYKMIENQFGTAFVKQLAMQQVVFQAPTVVQHPPNP